MSGEVHGVRAFRAALRSLVRALDGSLRAQAGASGVSTAQCHLLLEAAEGGEASIGEYARRLSLDQSTLSRTADGLVRLGYLERRPDPANRRRQLVRASRSGLKKAAGINLACDADYGRVLERIPEEGRAALLDYLGLLAQALREEAR